MAFYSPLLMAPADAAKQRFSRLAAEWKAHETPSSSVRDLAMHPAYQQIIGMGEAALPLILAELDRDPDHWFWALHSITGGVDPIPEESRGDLQAMSAAWINWGKSNGYRW